MKAVLHTGKIGKVLLIGALLMSFSIVNPFTSVITALEKGNVEGLSHYFDNMIEITLPGNTNSYSKSQAVVILKDFFSHNPVKGFKLIHKGQSGQGSSFGIGNLATSKGTFRTTFFFRQKGDDMVLQELRFEKSKR